VRDRFDDEWDKQIGEDARLGRLDHLAREALAEYRAGKSKENVRNNLKFDLT
jgi:hypothetical protein